MRGPIVLSVCCCLYLNSQEYLTPVRDPLGPRPNWLIRPDLNANTIFTFCMQVSGIFSTGCWYLPKKNFLTGQMRRFFKDPDLSLVLRRLWQRRKVLIQPASANISYELYNINSIRVRGWYDSIKVWKHHGSFIIKYIEIHVYCVNTVILHYIKHTGEQ